MVFVGSFLVQLLVQGDQGVPFFSPSSHVSPPSSVSVVPSPQKLQCTKHAKLYPASFQIVPVSLLQLHDHICVPRLFQTGQLVANRPPGQSLFLSSLVRTHHNLGSLGASNHHPPF
jgi:hypothetical protein